MSATDTRRERARRLHESLASCAICPRRCRVNRLEGETGFCGIGAEAVVSSAGPHFGEEDVLVGRGGSGTIFLAGCNLGCLFCQNYEISHGREGRPAAPADIARAMLRLERMGCVNINLVTPTHVTPQLMQAILLAREAGLAVPIVYNCGGYESVETLQALEGLIEIYMPDAKYADGAAARELSDAPDYPEVNRAALREMHRQVGDLEIEGGIATRGLLVRHLVLPNGLAGSEAVLDFLAAEISPRTYVNVMAQYRPCYRAGECPKVDRPPTRQEFAAAYDYAVRRGLRLAR
ncbi:MAG TPA: radical SAM protein [Planctomycetota bacterium]|nr:radical SAM protein [Planctomycetota bacterium]HRR81021.1 radical SAM protein [Planctomycetota bacterium]HRT93621.1 radical SAM protein [Planctomycetota bacterium]